MSYRSFEEVWQDIRRLEGKDVCTLCRHYKSHILTVNEEGVKRLAEESRDKEYKPVAKSKFERVWRDLVACRQVVPSKKSEGIAFTCACIAHLPEVEYSLNPVTIWLSENRHDFCKQVERKASK